MMRSCVVLALVVACGPQMPSEADARARYEAGQAALDAFASCVDEAVGALPSVARGAVPSCEATDEGSLEDIAAAVTCAQRVRALYAQRTEDAGKLEPIALQCGEAHDLRRGRVSLYTPEGELLESTFLVDGGAGPGGTKSGSVPPNEGSLVGERKLGWGLYQVPGSCGVWDSHCYAPGIEVAWSQGRAEGFVVKHTLVLLGP